MNIKYQGYKCTAWGARRHDSATEDEINAQR